MTSNDYREAALANETLEIIDWSRFSLKKTGKSELGMKYIYNTKHGEWTFEPKGFKIEKLGVIIK